MTSPLQSVLEAYDAAAHALDDEFAQVAAKYHASRDFINAHRADVAKQIEAAAPLAGPVAADVQEAGVAVSSAVQDASNAVSLTESSMKAAPEAEPYDPRNRV